MHKFSGLKTDGNAMKRTQCRVIVNRNEHFVSFAFFVQINETARQAGAAYGKMWDLQNATCANLSLYISRAYRKQFLPYVAAALLLLYFDIIMQSFLAEKKHFSRKRRMKQTL